MKRNPERPGLGFPTTSNKKASKTSGSTPSLFGLISKVNKGISEPEDKSTDTEEKTQDSGAIEAAKNAAKQIAERLAVENSLQKRKHIQEKRNQFLTAKANVERLFTGGDVTVPQKTPDPATATPAKTFKVPEPKDGGKGTNKSSADRPGLGFEETKKYFPKPVGMGRNVFTEDENKNKATEGKYSLVPYGYDDKDKSDEKDESRSGSRARNSKSSSRKERRFTEDGKKSTQKTEDGKRSSEKDQKSNQEADKDDGALQDDYFRYGFGKEEDNVGAGIPSTYTEPEIGHPSRDRSKRDYKDRHGRKDMKGRRKSRFENERNAEVNYTGRNQGFNNDFPGNQMIEPPIAVPIGMDPNMSIPMNPGVPIMDPNVPIMGPNAPIIGQNVPIMGPNVPIMGPNVPIMNPNMPIMDPNMPIMDPNVPIGMNHGVPISMGPGSFNFDGPPGQPIFLQAVPLNVVPLQPVNIEGPGDGFFDNRDHPDDRYPPGGSHRNYNDMERYGDDSYVDRYDDENFGWTDRRSRSRSRDRDRRSGRHRSKDRGRSPRRSTQSGGGRDSGWNNVDPKLRKQLEELDRNMGFSRRSRSPDRHRHGGRGGSLDRDHRGRTSRSGSPRRSRDSGIGSRGRSPKGASAAEDPFILGHRLFMEEREKKWEEIKAQNSHLTNVDKAMHPLFINAHRGGYLCKDCSVTCMDSGEYGLHLLSENHIRVVQLKAQELLLKERSGIITVPKPTPDPSHGDRSRDRIQSGDPSRGPRSRSRGRRSRSRERRHRSFSRERGRRSWSRDRAHGRVRSRSPDWSRESDRFPPGLDDVIVLDDYNMDAAEAVDIEGDIPKPQGPLVVEYVPKKNSCLHLSWNKDDSEEFRKLGIKFRVYSSMFSYTEPRTIWKDLGTTTSNEFLVSGLEEDKSYKFRITSLLGERESRSLYCNKVRTNSSDPAVQKYRNKAKNYAKMRKMFEAEHAGKTEEKLLTKHKNSIRMTEEKLLIKNKYNRRITEEQLLTKNKNMAEVQAYNIQKMFNKGSKAHMEPVNVTIDIAQPSEANIIHRQMIEEKRREAEKLKKQREDDQRQAEEEARKKEREEWLQREKILLYDKLKDEKGAWIGLEYMLEIQEYNPSAKPKYRCKLCTASLTGNSAVAHLNGLPHKMKYFEQHNPDIFEKLMLVNDRKMKKSMVEKHAQIILNQQGWGTMSLVRMENPEDHEGRVIFTEPVSLPPPEYKAPAGPAPSVEEIQKEVDGVLEDQNTVRYTEDGEMIRHFDRLLQDAEVQKIKNGEKIEPALGLQCLVELMHPENKELPRYQCHMCKTNCAQTNILNHVWGRAHRIAYLKSRHKDVFEAIMSIKDKEEQNNAIDAHSQEIEEMIGREPVKSVIARNTRLWDWARTVAEKAAKAKKDQQEAEAAEAAKARPDPVKFGVKAKEQSTSNVQPTNVLETAEPPEKESVDWNTENALVQERINNGSIIKSTRPAKFNTVYSAFFKQFPVVGIHWVTEFQKPDKNDEPWYLCYLCQCKITWKSILDHLTSINHRTNYLKKSYSTMHKLLLKTAKGSNVLMKNKLEEYCLKIMSTEPVQNFKMDVMLELNFTKSLVAAAKEQERAGGENTAATAPSKPERKSAALETAFSSGFSAIADSQPEKEPDSSRKTHKFSDLNESHSPHMQAQSSAQSIMNMQSVATSQLQSHVRPSIQNTQPVQAASVANVGHTRGFSSQQILPGQPIPRQAPVSLVPSASVPSQQLSPPVVSGPTRLGFQQPRFATSTQGVVRPPVISGPMNVQPPASLSGGTAGLPMVQQPPNIGISQPNVSVQQQNTGLQPNVQVQQANAGVQQMNTGLRPSIGAQPMNVGTQHPNMGVRPPRPGLNRPDMNQPRGTGPGVREPRFNRPRYSNPRPGNPNITADKPRHDWSKFRWSKTGDDQGNSPDNLSASGTTQQNEEMADNSNIYHKTDDRLDRNVEDFDNWTDQDRGFERHGDRNVKGEKRKDFRGQSPEYPKKARHSRSRSPDYRTDRRNYSRDTEGGWGRSAYDESEPIPEEGERVVRLLSPRSERDGSRTDRQHRHSSEYSREEYGRHYDRDRNYPDIIEDERHRSDWDRYDENRYGERQTERERRSRSPQSRRRYDYHHGRARSPYERRWEEDRSEEHYRGDSRDRYSDHGTDRHLDEGEATDRGGPERADIQALLAQVSSTMKMMSEEDRQMMEEELKRNLPQAFQNDDQASVGTAGAQGQGGPRGRGSRGAWPPRGEGFQRRGR